MIFFESVDSSNSYCTVRGCGLHSNTGLGLKVVLTYSHVRVGRINVIIRGMGRHGVHSDPLPTACDGAILCRLERERRRVVCSAGVLMGLYSHIHRTVLFVRLHTVFVPDSAKHSK